MAQSLWLACISHAIYTEFEYKKVALRVMKRGIEDDAPMPASRSEKERQRRIRKRAYVAICFVVPMIYFTLCVAILGNDLCDYAAFTDIPRGLVIGPEIVTIVPSIAFVVMNWSSAKECATLLGVGKTSGVSIDSSNFSRHSIYFGMIVVFGCTRLPAVIAEISRIAIGNDDLDISKVLLAVYFVFVPLQGLVLMIWFAWKLKYVQLWRAIWTHDVMSTVERLWKNDAFGRESSGNHSTTVVNDIAMDASSSSSLSTPRRPMDDDIPVIETFSGVL